MATAISIADSFTNTADGLTFSGGSGSYLPVTDRLTVACTMAHDDGAGSPNQTLSGCGMTWSVLTDGTASATRLDSGSASRNKLFRPTAGTPASGSLTIDCGAVTCERARLVVLEFTESANANVVQIVNASGTSTTPLSTLAAVGSANNMVVGVFVSRTAGPTFSPGSGLTVLSDVNVEAGATRVVVVYGNNVTAITGTYSSSAVWTSIAFEVSNVPGTGYPAARNLGRAPHGLKGVRIY